MSEDSHRDGSEPPVGADAVGIEDKISIDAQQRVRRGFVALYALAYIGTILLFLASTILFAIAFVAYTSFYYSYIPIRGIHAPIYLQFHHHSSSAAVSSTHAQYAGYSRATRDAATSATVRPQAVMRMTNPLMTKNSSGPSAA